MNIRRAYIGIAVGLLTIHALVLMLVRSPVATSDLLLDAAAIFSCIVCHARSSICFGSVRWKWRLLAGGILIWCVGQTIITYDEGLLHLQQAPTAINSDFFFFLFGIPLLLAISSAHEDRRSAAFLWIDGLQAVLAVYLIHRQLFPGLNGSAEQGAISSLRMTYAYNAEDFILVLASGLRLLAKPQSEEKAFYRTLFLFLCVYTISAAILNHLSAVEHVPTGTSFDLLWDIPFLLLVVLVTRLPRTSETRVVHRHTSARLLITNGSPIFFSLALLMMGVYVMRDRFVLGAAAIVFALVSHGLRNALLQTYFMQTEHLLLESEAKLLDANQTLEQLTLMDGLTGIANRRRFEEALLNEWSRVQRSGGPLSLLVIDIDYFKLLNDRYGHLQGDACLVATARALAQCLRRPGELLARYGGEEFVAILPAIGHKGALLVAEQMRSAVEQLLLPNEDAPGKRMTVSIGVAVHRDGLAPTSNDLFAFADQALYSAKFDGRNRVHAHGLLNSA